MPGLLLLVPLPPVAGAPPGPADQSCGRGRRLWDARSAEDGSVYGEAPNDFLQEQLQALPVGDALCLAEGGGRNGVFLAECGHRVIVQDISPVGLASQRGVSITTRCTDLNDDDLAVGGADLVVAIWIHLPPSMRARVHRRLVQVLRPGGHLILEETRREIAEGPHHHGESAVVWVLARRPIG